MGSNIGYKFYIVYKTTNLINGKIYVGQHCTNKLDDGYLGSGKYLKRSIKKRGKRNFKREILEICESKSELNTREIYWIKELNAIKKGYNCHEKPEGGYISEEVYLKLSKELKGVKKSKIHMKRVIEGKIRNGTLNHTEATKNKISNTLRENYTKVSSKERKIKHGHSGELNPMYGKKNTQESINKIKEIAKNRPKVTCPYCGKFGTVNRMKVYHFDNCKFKNL